MDLARLREEAMHVAVDEIGTKEVGGNNRGRRVEEYLAACRLPPGQPWCAAFVVWCYDRAAEAHGFRNPLPRIGHVGKLWRAGAAHWKSDIPTLWAVACHQEDPTDHASSGHTGIVIAISPAFITTVEGNTNEAGSREGGAVLIKSRHRDYWNLGFIDLGRNGPALPPRMDG